MNMDPHQQPGALDALINDGLQHIGADLDRLVHESVQDVLEGSLPDVGMVSLPGTVSLGLPPMSELPMLGDGGNPAGALGDDGVHSNDPNGVHETHSHMRETNASGVNTRARRRNQGSIFQTDEEESDDVDDEDDDEDDDPQETGSSGRPGRGKRRRSANGDMAGPQGSLQRNKSTSMTGRFSGRLPSKDDERKLADECLKMGQLLSSDGSLTTLPTIIRAMATGIVRAHLEKQKNEFDAAMARLAIIESGPGGNSVVSLGEQVISQQNEMQHLRNHLYMLEQKLAEAGAAVREAEVVKHENALHRVNSMAAMAMQAHAGQQPAMSAMQAMTMSSLPVSTQPSSAPPPVAPQQSLVINAGPSVVQTMPPTSQMVQFTAAAEPMQTTALVAQQVLPNGVSQPVVVATLPSSAVGPGGMRSVPSSAHLLDAMGQPTGVTVAVQQATVVSAQPPSASGEDPAAAAAGVAASNLTEHAQQLAVTAKLHEAAKTEASAQAQQLAAQAQQHAQASVQAAQQAEELKKSLAVLPDGTHYHAAATVQNLEAQAQAHANITTQVVAQARGMHEKAQAHEKEQIKAITQATVLQAHAQSLSVSAAQMEAHAGTTSAVCAAATEPQQLPPIAVAPVPSIHVSTGVPCASGGGALAHSTDPNQQPITPHSATSNGATQNILTSATTMSASAHVPPPVTMSVVAPQPPSVIPMQLPNPQPMLVVQQQPMAGGSGVVQLASITSAAEPGGAGSLGPPPSLVPQRSGDHSADVAVLQQQIAVLQAQQQAQAQVNAVQAAAVAQVAQAQAVQQAHVAIRPPVAVQILTSTAMPTTQPSINQNMASLTMLPNVGSSALPATEGSLPAPPAETPVTSPENETSGHTPRSGGVPGVSTEMPDVPAAMLFTDAAGADAAAALGPIVALPEMSPAMPVTSR